MVPSEKWFVIINPTSGNGSAKHKWSKIELLLKSCGFEFDFAFTQHENHSFELVQTIVKQGIKKIICVGGDGTLHNIINGIMNQNIVSSDAIVVGIIPIGTGNDWIKTHNIPNNIEKAVSIIKNGVLKTQDLGKIVFLNDDKKPVFFNNLAGVGFDGLVVSKVYKYKHFGAAAYLLGAVLGLFSFRNFKSKIVVNCTEIDSKTFMTLVGLCSYSGGGMQLTKDANPFDGLLDVSIVKNISKLDILKNLHNLFNGKIVNHKKVDTHKSESISIEINQEYLPYIQADGEIIGKGNIKISIVPKAFSFFSN